LLLKTCRITNLHGYISFPKPRDENKSIVGKEVMHLEVVDEPNMLM